jgi:hypothetical protein
MNQPAFDPHSGPNRPFDSDASGRLHQAGQQHLLEKVLQMSLTAEKQQDAIDEADLQGLAQIARRYPGQPLSLTPVTLEIVQFLLAPWVKSLAGSPERWRRLTLRIASSLFDDPVARGRLEMLWQRVSESGR